MPKKPTILIADDDVDAVEMLQHRLHNEGFTTVSAGEGIRAIELAHRHHPDVILLDIRMPAGDGPTVLNALQSKGATQSIPVIAITAFSSDELREKVLSSGARAFFEKPYDINALIQEIRGHLAG
jgi:CheY-like chemotaxis protein